MVVLAFLPAIFFASVFFFAVGLARFSAHFGHVIFSVKSQRRFLALWLHRWDLLEIRIGQQARS